MTIAGHPSMDLDPKTEVYPETSGAESMSRYVALIEETGTGYSAHVPDLPGCIAAPEAMEKPWNESTKRLNSTFEGMLLHGEHLPEPTTLAELVEVALSTAYRDSSRDPPSILKQAT